MSEKETNNADYLEHHPDAVQDINDAHEIALASSRNRSIAAEHKGALRLIGEELSENRIPTLRAMREEDSTNKHEGRIASTVQSMLIHLDDPVKKSIYVEAERARYGLKGAKEDIDYHTKEAERIERFVEDQVLNDPRRVGQKILEVLEKTR